jgi:methionyl-tRNA formyltransferase
MEKAAQRDKDLAREAPGVVFMGTPDFALPSLSKLSTADVRILMVVTQPDRHKGRGKKLLPPPVKTLAETLNIPIFQPERAKEKETIEFIRAANAECAVVVAYGQILSEAFLELFPLGVLNVHASLLPKHRGAAPIHRSILGGEGITGVSIMLLDAGMDTGPVLSQRELPVDETDTFGTVHDKLALVGADLLVETLMEWRAGRIEPRPQEEALATYAPPIRKEELRIDWRQGARKIVDQIRAFDPWPGAYSFCDGKRVKCFTPSTLPWKGEGKPGEVFGHTESALVVSAGDGQAVSVGELQLEGQRRLPAAEFLRGRPIPAGSMMDWE